MEERERGRVGGRGREGEREGGCKDVWNGEGREEEEVKIKKDVWDDEKEDSIHECT